MNQLMSKTALVTGAAAGIRRTNVRRMAEEDVKVAVFDMLLVGCAALPANLADKEMGSPCGAGQGG